MQPTDQNQSDTPSDNPVASSVPPVSPATPTIINPDSAPAAAPSPAPEQPLQPESATVFAAPTSPATPAVVVSSPAMTETPNSVPSGLPPVPPKKKSRRKFWIFGGAGLLVVLLATAGVFGWYLPNTPSNVYNTAITRSGKAVDSLVQNATNKQKLEALKTSKISGSVDATFAGSHYSGDFTTSFDKTSSDSNLNVSFNNGVDGQQTVNLKGLTQIPSGKVYPDVYLQLNGIKNLGLDEFIMPGISGYDGKWIFVSSTYLQSLGDEFLKTDDNTKTSITAEDVAEIARTTSSVSRDYLFSTYKDKAVLEKRDYIGKEKVDGIQAYHYKVSVNVAHAKAYCKALSNAVFSSAAYKKVTGKEATSKDKTDAANSCETGDYSSLSDSYDMWIDGHYKLIYKIRFYDEKNKDTYADVGQLYKGGDKLSLFVRGHDKESKIDGSFTLDTDLKTNQTSGDLSVKGTDSEIPFDLKIKLKAEINGEAVKITPPATSVKIEDVLKQFGIDPSTGAGSSISMKAEDTEKKTDINSLQAQLEAVYANTGVYPLVSYINDPAKRKTIMPNVDSNILAPTGTSPMTLAGTATAEQYGYQTTDCKGDGCQKYTLTALLSDGTSYSKQSLN